MSALAAYHALAGTEGIDAVLDASLRQHTTYHIGGPADLLIVAHTYQALARTMRELEAQAVPWVILGRGSNVLAADAGYRGCVIKLGEEFSRLSVEGTLVTAGAAVMLPKLVNETLTRELSGLEPCAGIPGTVGGAISMDAGSRHEWIGSVVHDVVTLRSGQGMFRRSGSQIEWGYRRCSIPAQEIILEATFELTPSRRDLVAAEMNRRLARRRVTQPTGKPSCGSVFRNPGDRSVGMLLEECGFRGMQVGGARVSDQHANFIVNEGSATAVDVLTIINRMHEAVQDRFGIDLACEVKFLGFEG